MINFDNKHILLISPYTFGLASMIVKNLEHRGARVRYFRENTSKRIFTWQKQCVRYFHADIVDLHRNYYRKIVDILKNEATLYDALLVIRGEYLTTETLDEISKCVLKKNAITVLYLWDSFSNLQNTKKIDGVFDKRYSFDTADCKKDKQYELLPLFWNQVMDKSKDIEWDLSFVGSFYDDRYERVKKINDANSDLKKYLKLHLQTIGYIRRSLLIYKSFKYLDRELLTNKPIPRDKVNTIFSKSKAVLDVQSEKQSGLTLRTIECVGSNYKIITSNQSVKEYDFYQYGNVLVLEEGNWNISREWLNTPPCEVPDEVRNKYSLDTWLDTVFSGI